VTPDHLGSWNDGAAKAAIVDFVDRVTRPRGSDFVPPPERIAVFDNDGTLWTEMPVPVQVFFVQDRLKALLPNHPEWLTNQPFTSMLAGDLKGVMATGMKGITELVMTTHAAMTTDQFSAIVREWLTTARHPKVGRPYTGVVYQPMLELLRYLREHGFTTFIVSGGGVEFMRVFAEDTYGVPPHQVVGSTIKTHFEMRDGKPVLMRDPELDFFDDKAGKPVAINKFIGRRPVACFGNSDGDHEMLLWTTEGRSDGRPTFGLLVHHTDAEREFAYDREHVPSGQLDKALDDAAVKGWTVVDMKTDWSRVYP
jgi:haloacid dehalogenase-like hydrolase